MISIYKTDESTMKLNTLKKIEIDSWINVENPTLEEIKQVSETLGIDESYLKKIMDDDEPSRIDVKDDIQTMIIDIPRPITKKDYTVSVTAPLILMQIKNQYILTICSKKTGIFDDFINGKIDDFYTSKKSRFILQIMYKSVLRYIKDLKIISEQIEKSEDTMKKSTQNSDLMNLMNLRKSLIYFQTSLKSNEIVLEKLKENDLITMYEEDKDILDNLLIEHKQASEMAQIYNGLLNSTIEIYGTIISNNLNNIMKFLAGITIVISIPTMVSSFMGMNVPLGVFGTNGLSFLLILSISILLSLIVAYILKKKNML